MEKYGIIYIITNTIDNKVYIGQTTRSFDERYNGDIKKHTHNVHLKNAIEAYGIENFNVEKEAYIAYSKEELDAKEIELISKYNATDKRYGYNFLSGGHRGKHNSESRRKIGIAQIGKLNHMYGKYGKNNPNYSRVSCKCDYCGKDIEVLRCTMKRSTHHYCSVECKKLDQKNIIKHTNSKIELRCEVCNKIYYKYPSQIKDKKYLCCSRNCLNELYKTKFNGINNPNYNNGSKINGSNNGRAKKVLCITTGEKFDCARDAEKHYKIGRGLVAACCRGEQKTSNGLEWKYL